MNAIVTRIVIGYGSESGNARTLAQRLGAEPELQTYAPQVVPLNEVRHQELNGLHALIIISSSFGDGEPPANAELFLEQVRQASALPGLRYAIFGLGDTAYPSFCGFTKTLDNVLAERQAQPLMRRVDADASYENFFARWVPVLCRVLQGDAAAGAALDLQVTAYGEANAYAANILERRQLNDSCPGAWHIRLDISGSGMVYRAGDNLYVLPENDPALLRAISRWYGSDTATTLLHKRELRQLGKGLLRDLARLSGNEHLKAMLKISQRKELDEYLWGADLLDLLEDFCTPQTVPLEQLAAMLPNCLPRAYSIASAGGTSVDLCVREIVHERGNRRRRGCATSWLLGHEGRIPVFCRSNPGFHLPRDTSIPLVLVGTGTGIAPLMGLLREIQASGKARETCLVFGERHCDSDFLYREELQTMQQAGSLTHLFTAFSRDGDCKYYVQDAIAEHGNILGDMLSRGAHLYLCGNKQHLEQAVSQAIDATMAVTALQDNGDDTADSGWQTLAREGRLHRELY